MANADAGGHAVEMKTPSLAGPALRVATALLLCAACFQAGRWYQELSVPAARHAKAAADPGNEMVSATFRGAAEPAAKTVEPAPLSAVGDPVGQAGDIITPLNVRDPSALVMGPSAGPPECIAPSAAPASPPAKQLRPIKPLKSGRLLELLKKADKKSDAPKLF